MSEPADGRIGEILGFWFAGAQENGRREVWFKSTDAFDREIRDRFLDLQEAAAGGALEAWKKTPEGTLALILLLDQFPRNLFRGTARAFATDEAARAAARHALESGFHQGADNYQRIFLGLPFVHSEDPADQEQSMRLAATLDEAKSLESATEHRDLIARFGRFPHRNAALGRQSTPEEEAYLAAGAKTYGQGEGT